MTVKARLYKLMERTGLLNSYLKFLFLIKRIFAIRQKEHTALFSFYKQFIHPDSIVFDIGANLGTRTGVFANLGKKVIALEPNDTLFDILQSRFHSQPEITVLKLGCGSVNETKEFKIATNHLVSSFSEKFIEHKKAIGEDRKWAKSIHVEMVTLDRLIDKYGKPDFCKIDVEGFEKEVLSGLSLKIGTISFEFNAPTFNTDSIDCINKLIALGYSSFNISYGESLTLEFDQWISGLSLIELIKTDLKFKTACYGDIYVR